MIDELLDDLDSAQLDALERDAEKKFAGRRVSSRAASCAASQLDHNDLENVVSTPGRVEVNGKSVQVRLYELNGRVAAKAPYNEKLKAICQKVQGRTWNVQERAWTFALEKLEEVASLLISSGVPVNLQVEAPLKFPESTATSCIQNSSQTPHEGSESSSFKASEGSFEHLEGFAPSQEQQQGQKDGDAAAHQSESSQAPMVQRVVKLQLRSDGLVGASFEYHNAVVAVVRAAPMTVWNPTERMWMFPYKFLPEVRKLLSAVQGVDVTLEDLDPLIHRALTATAEQPNCEDRYSRIPHDLEASLLPFQREGVRFVLQRGGRALIADEMGLGKTLQAIAVSACFEEEWPVLVAVPSALRLHWAMAIRDWLHVDPSHITVVMTSGAGQLGFKIERSGKNASYDLSGHFNVVSYDLFPKLPLDLNFKVVIADESHYLKNPAAQRTKSCTPFIKKARRAILLSGTPALSRPIELFKQLEALQPKVYRTRKEYGQLFCQGGYYGEFTGCSHREELHALAKATLMLRRLKADVLPQLPPKRRQQMVLELTDMALRPVKDLFAELNKLKDAINKARDPETMQQLRFMHSALITKIYRTSAEAKKGAVQDYVGTLLEADCKFLVFAHHRIMLDAVEETLQKRRRGYVRIDGATPQAQRPELVASFQNDAMVQVAVLSIQAAGMGLTLTAASTVVFAEMSWTPGDLRQAEDRVHRIGQPNSVNIIFLQAPGTIDDVIWDTVQNKLDNLGQVMDGQETKLTVTDTQHQQRAVQGGQRTLDSFLLAPRRMPTSSSTEEGNSDKDGQFKSSSPPEWTLPDDGVGLPDGGRRMGEPEQGPSRKHPRLHLGDS